MNNQRPATVTITGWVLLLSNFFALFNAVGILFTFLILSGIGHTLQGIVGTGNLLSCIGIILSGLMGVITGGAVLQGKKSARLLYLAYLAISMLAFWLLGKIALVPYFSIWYVLIFIFLNRKRAREYFNRNLSAGNETECEESKQTIIRKTIGGFLFIIGVLAFNVLALVAHTTKVKGHDIVIVVCCFLFFTLFFLVPGIFIWGRKDIRLLIGLDCTISGCCLLNVVLLLRHIKQAHFFGKDTTEAAILFSMVLLVGIIFLYLDGGDHSSKRSKLYSLRFLCSI